MGCQCELQSIYFNGPITNRKQFGREALSSESISLPPPQSTPFFNSPTENQNHRPTQFSSFIQGGSFLSVYFTVPKMSKTILRKKPQKLMPSRLIVPVVISSCIPPISLGTCFKPGLQPSLACHPQCSIGCPPADW